MAAEPTTAKLCTVCGIDCSSIPRIKDQQGRYICKECFDKAKQTRQTQKNPTPAPAPARAVAAAPDLNDNTFLLNLGSKESTGIQGTKPCPECGRAMPANAVICIGCGYNTSTGKRHAVKVIKTKQKAVKESSSSSGGGGGGGGIPPAAVGLILLVVYGGLIGAAFASQQFLLPALGIGGFISFAIGIWGAVVAFQEGIGTGLLYLLLPFYSLYFIYAKNDNETLKWAFGMSLVGSIALNVISSMSMMP